MIFNFRRFVCPSRFNIVWFRDMMWLGCGCKVTMVGFWCGWNGWISWFLMLIRFWGR